MNWIKTSEKMPEHHKDVLGWWLNDEQHVVYFSGYQWVRPMDKEKWDEPEYWRKLPKGPDPVPDSVRHGNDLGNCPRCDEYKGEGELKQ